MERIAKETLVFGLGMILRRLASFILLPIYTRYLTPADYGVVEMLTLALEFISIVVGMRISQVLFRYYNMESDLLEKKKIVTTILSNVFIAGLIGVAISQIFAPTILHVLLGSEAYEDEFRILSITILTGSLLNYSLSYLRVIGKVWLFFSVSILVLALQIVSNLYFVVYEEMHVTGVVYGSVISSLIASIIAVMYLVIRNGYFYKSKGVAEYYRYIAPLVLSSLLAFYAFYIDRYMIRLTLGLNDVGIYSLALRISSVLVMVYEMFNMSWSNYRFIAVKQNDGYGLFKSVSLVVFSVYAYMAAGIILLAPDAVYFLASSPFQMASGVIPFVVVGLIFHGYILFYETGPLVVKKTGIIARSSWVKAVLVTLLLAILLPNYGLIGAALSVTISRLGEFAYLLYGSQKLYKMPFSFKLFLFSILLAVLSGVMGGILPVGVVFIILVKLVLLLAMLYLVLIVYLYERGYNEGCYQFLRGVVGRIKSDSSRIM